MVVSTPQRVCGATDETRIEHGSDVTVDNPKAPFPIDSSGGSADNLVMSTDTRTSVDPDTEALMERILHGKPLDPDVYRRIQERGSKITEEIRREFGTVEIAVDLVRESRDEV